MLVLVSTSAMIRMLYHSILYQDHYMSHIIKHMLVLCLHVFYNKYTTAISL